MNGIIDSKHILKNLHDVLVEAKSNYTKRFEMQEVKLKDNFKIAFRSYLSTKNCAVNYFEHTTIVTNSVGQNIYIANQWFVIASYFVDFCSEMISYRELFEKVCRRMGMNIQQMKAYATHLKESPTSSDKSRFITNAVDVIKDEFRTFDDDYDKIALYLWKFASNYNWWAGSKTIDRHDFYISALLNQMNVVNANSEYLAIISLAYASILNLRIMVEDVDYFTIGFKRNDAHISQYENSVPIVNNLEYEELPEENAKTRGILISAASFERFKQNN